MAQLELKLTVTLLIRQVRRSHVRLFFSCCFVGGAEAALLMLKVVDI